MNMKIRFVIVIGIGAFIILFSVLFFTRRVSTKRVDEQIVAFQRHLENISKDFLNENYMEDLKIIWQEDNFKKKFDSCKVILAKPFIIYGLDKINNQMNEINYPVYYEDRCFGVITVMQINNKWTYDISTDTSLTLDKINYNNKNMIFYQKGSEVLAEDENDIWVYQKLLQDKETSGKEKKFAEKSWADKVQEIYLYIHNIGQ